MLEGWRCGKRIRSIITMAAEVRPMINPHQKPAGPARGTIISVSARQIAARQTQHPVRGKGNEKKIDRVSL